jgi:pilus biogenesis lipoprotein CpaD
MERAGVIRTLAEPNLTAISGETPTFIAGGEFPIPNGLSCDTTRSPPLCQPQITFKKFGVSLVFTPVVLSEGRISLKVMTEVSDLSTEKAMTIQITGSTTSLTVPSIQTRRAETTIEIPSGGSLALAGMIQEQTRQAINGIPALMQIPVLGALFKSRDYVNHQSELMVLVTPYVVRAVAQKQLSRPDDGFAGYERSAGCSAWSAEPHLRRAGQGRRAADQRISRQIRIHSRLSGAGKMKAIQGRSALRLLAVGGFALVLSGCYKTPVVAEYPVDYRQRHPIVVREGVQNVVMVGRNRGGLTPSQRADMISLAQAWRRESGSGVIIDVPRGGPTDRAAADSTREIRSILAAVGVPSNAIYIRHYRPSRTSLASIRLNYSKLIAEAGPCGQWPWDLGPSIKSRDFENRPYWNLGCATQRNLAAMVDNPADLIQPRGEIPPWSPRRTFVINKWTKGENPSGTYTGYDTGKISDLGK